MSRKLFAGFSGKGGCLLFSKHLYSFELLQYDMTTVYGIDTQIRYVNENMNKWLKAYDRGYLVVNGGLATYYPNRFEVEKEHPVFRESESYTAAVSKLLIDLDKAHINRAGGQLEFKLDDLAKHS